MDLDTLIIRVQAMASGVQAGVDEARASLGQLDKGNEASAAIAKKAAQEAATAYKLSAIEADALALKAKQAGEKEKAALEETARKAREAAAVKKMAAETAALAYEQAERAARELADEERKRAEEAKRLTQEAAQAKAVEAAAYAALAAAARVAFNTIVSSIWRGVSASNNYANALVGLRSIVEGTGNDFGAAKRFVDEFTEDGLIPAADAATALKNLLARGYTDEQASEVLRRIKDAAAFGRQGQLSLGEAVKSATEGLKNENSVLVDNAGITKNVSIMHKEYAAQIGKAVTELTQAEKIQAEYNGIMQETAHQVGDAAKYAAEFSGAQSRFQAEGVKAWQAYGDAMKPVLTMLIGGTTDGTIALREFIEENKGLVAGLTAGTVAATGFVLAVSGVEALILLFQKLNIVIGITNGVLKVSPLAWGLMAVAAIATVGTAIASMESAAEKANRELQKSLELLEQTRNKQRSLDSIAAEYEELSSKVNRTAEEQARLEKIERELVTTHGLAANSINAYGEAVFRGVDALREFRDELEKIAQIQKLETFKTFVTTYQDDLQKQKEAVAGLKDVAATITLYEAQIEELERRRQERLERYEYFSKQSYGDTKELLRLTKGLSRLKDSVKRYQAELDAANKRIQDGARTATDLVIREVEASGAVIDEALRQVAYDQARAVIEAGGITEETIEQVLSGIAETIAKIAFDKEALRDAFSGLPDVLHAAFELIIDQFNTTEMSLEEKKKRLQAILNEVAALGLDESLGQLALLKPSDVKEGEAALRDYQEALTATQDKILEMGGITESTRLKLLSGISSEANSTQEALNRVAEENEKALGIMMRGMRDAGRAAEIMDQKFSEINAVATLNRALEGYKATTKGTQEYKKALDELAQASGINAELIEADLGLVERKAAAADEELRAMLDAMYASIGVDLAKDIPSQLAAIAASATDANAPLAQLLLILYKLQAAGGTTPPPVRTGGGARKSAYQQQLDTLEHLRRLEAISDAEEIARLERIQKLYAKSADDKRDIEERLYRARKDYQQKLYDDELKALDYRKALGQITVDEEIANLRRILAEHAKTTDQRMELERRLYALQQEQRGGEVDQLNRLNDGILAALRARYEEQQRIEQDRIQASIDGWRAWADESKKAIQEQIDALDELNKTADRDAQDAEELRKIEATRQLIVYEKDAYNREQLEKELERLEKARADRLRKNAIDDEKARLRAEMQIVDERAKVEQDALRDQLSQLDDAYEERLKNYNLQAEAERMITRNNQQEILNIIRQY